MTWNDLTFTSSHILTASDMNRLQGNFAALAAGAAGAPALAVNSFTVTGVASIATLHVSSGASIAGGGLPTGAVIPYAGTSAPSGWLLCDGSAVNRSTYAGLFAVIGEVFGVGDGSSTFNVPDLRGRGVVALDNLGGSSADRIAATWADSLGGAGGEETHQLVPGELPTGVTAKATFANGEGSGNPDPADSTEHGNNSGRWLAEIRNFALDNANDEPHNNVPPSMALGYVIKT